MLRSDGCKLQQFANGAKVISERAGDRQLMDVSRDWSRERFRVLVSPRAGMTTMIQAAVILQLVRILPV